MPDRSVKTIQDLIFYQYAKIIAKSAMKTGDKIQGIHNIVYACKHCNSAKHDTGLYTFFNKLNRTVRDPDLVPPLLEKKYLKLMWCCHKCAGTLDKGDLNGDGRLDVLDIDAIIERKNVL